MTKAEREKLLIDMRSLHASRRNAIRRRLGEFRRVDPSEYFYELAYCLLTPQTSAENAGRVVDKLREWLVKNVSGLGYKEATHFLRNVGRNGGLAILDRHILRNLKRLAAIRFLPKTLSRKNYLSIEQQFMRLAERSGIPLDELDLLFWSMETGVIRK